MNMTYKVACAIGLYMLWAILVIALKLNPADLISAIKIGLMAVGGWLGVVHLQAVPENEIDGTAPTRQQPAQGPGGAPQAPSFPSQ